ncbi:MAG: hypothetical protein ACR2NQ_02060 [Thermodesulfobacteriota bacterium]
MREFGKKVRDKIDSEFSRRFPDRKRQDYVTSDDVLGRGGADFCEPYLVGTPVTVEERVLGYCSRYFRMHYDSSYEVFSWLFQNPEHFTNTLFLDFGCGPGTSGVAFTDFMKGGDFQYVGVDRSPEMLKRGEEFLSFCGVIDRIFCDGGNLSSILYGRKAKIVIFNLCFSLGAGTFKGNIDELCALLNYSIEEISPKHAYIVYQNPEWQDSGHHVNWERLKSSAKGFSPLQSTPRQVDYGRRYPVHCDILYKG